MNVLFVCTGNTCRSPMAEGLLRKKAADENASMLVLSAGIHAFPGMPVSREAAEAVSAIVDIKKHKARSISDEFMAAADVVVVMTESHKTKLQQLYPLHEDKVITFLEMAGKEGDVADPYGSPQSVYNECAKALQEGIDVGWQYLQRWEHNHNENCNR